jgi:hypothetical protein
MPQDRKAARLGLLPSSPLPAKSYLPVFHGNEANQKVSTGVPSGPGWDQLSLIYKWIEEGKTDGKILSIFEPAIGGVYAGSSERSGRSRQSLGARRVCCR